MGEGDYSSAEVLRLTGLTARQLHYTVLNHLIDPFQPAQGSGSRIRWDDNDVLRLQLIGQLRYLDLEDDMVRLVLDRLDNATERWLLLGRAGAVLTTADRLLPRMLMGKALLVIDLAKFRPQ